MGKAQSSQGIKRTPTKDLLLPVYRLNPKNAIGLKRWQAYMHQNLLNAGFAFGDYLSDKNENVQAIWVIKPLTKVLSRHLSGSFFCTYACNELHFRVKSFVKNFLCIWYVNFMWSIRMRASKTASSQREIHISGAEGLYEMSDIQGIVKRYIERALKHPKGKADKIIITIESIKQKPRSISTLPIATVNCNTPAEGKNTTIKLLQSLGISKKAIDMASELIRKGNMRGAAIITTEKGNRLEPDKEKGVRASRLGISKSASRVLSLKLSKHGINTDTVKEALILASKVASSEHVLAELCVSDDPDYTTGYVASKKFGYLRIPNIKHEGSKSGGRAFFVREGMNVEGIIGYLEKMPVIIGRVASCKGIMSLDGILKK